MGFQILNKENEPIGINTLDEEACEFWGKPIHKKRYADPSKEDVKVFDRQTNWFDFIGHIIHSPVSARPYYQGWKEVKKNLIMLYMESAFFSKEDNLNTPEYVGGYYDHIINGYIKPYLDLIDHWESKGYTPKKVD